MKPFNVSFFAVIISWAIMQSAYGGQNIIRFELTSDMIEIVCQNERKQDRFEITIFLNPGSREYFTKLTEESVGKRLELTYDGLIILCSGISTKIDSGVILLGQDFSASEAARVMNLFNEGKRQYRWIKPGSKNRSDAASTENDYLRSAMEKLGNFHETGDHLLLMNGLKFVERAISDNPELCDGYYYQSIFLLHLGENTKAITALNQGIEAGCATIEYKIGSFHLLKGIIFHKDDNLVDANHQYALSIGYLKMRLSERPTEMGTLTELIQAYCLMGNRNEALKVIEKLKISNPELSEMLESAHNFVDEFDVSHFIESF
jgi:tetratricopeptide (TPR) repeat protein